MSVKDIILRRKGKIEISNSSSNGVDNSIYVASISANITSLGYIFSEELFNKLKTKSIDELDSINTWLVEELKKLVGANVEYKPMYPGFPKEVMKKKELELYFNAIAHYWKRDLHNLGLKLDEKDEIPKKTKKYSKKKVKNIKYKILNLASDNERYGILINILNSSVSFSPQDREDLKVYAKEENILKYIPEKITNRENLAFLMALVLDYETYLPNEFENLTTAEKTSIKQKALNKAIKNGQKLQKFINTPIDVLRIYVGLCDGDLSLASPTKFKVLPQKLRRFILSLFEKTEDMGLYLTMKDEMFKKVFQYLHVDEQKDKNGNLLYPKTSKAINEIRDSKFTRSFLSFVQEAINENNIEKAVNLLSQEPGVFARKLDEMLRLSNGTLKVLYNFAKVSPYVDCKILFTLREHFKNRTQNADYRVFFPKGNTSKAHAIENNLPPISEELSKEVVDVCEMALKRKFRNKPSMGKVYIDENLKSFKAPLVLRNLTPGSKVIVRGSRIPVEKGKDTLRAFIWWKDNVDNDLSAVLLDKDWKYNCHISFTNLKAKYGCHSGDITYQRDNGVDGECEFIDINTKVAKDDGIRYVAFEVHNFRGLTFEQSNCKFGFMERKSPFVFCNGKVQIYPNTQEVFEPLKVKHVMDLAAPATTILPFVYDIESREIIWCDMAIKNNFHVKTAENTLPGAIASCYSCINSQAPNLYDVLYINALARGEIVTNKNDAETIFSLEEGVTPYDIDVIVANYLNN